jgi:hypothetical protein
VPEEEKEEECLWTWFVTVAQGLVASVYAMEPESFDGDWCELPVPELTHSPPSMVDLAALRRAMKPWYRMSQNGNSSGADQEEDEAEALRKLLSTLALTKQSLVLGQQQSLPPAAAGSGSGAALAVVPHGMKMRGTSSHRAQVFWYNKRTRQTQWHRPRISQWLAPDMDMGPQLQVPRRTRTRTRTTW